MNDGRRTIHFFVNRQVAQMTTARRLRLKRRPLHSHTYGLIFAVGTPPPPPPSTTTTF